MTPVKSAVLSQSTSQASTSSHLNQMLKLLRTLMEYRSSEVRQRLEKVGREASMLHMDVLLLIYHFARFAAGNILEIGPYIGGSTIAAAFGARRMRYSEKNCKDRSRGTIEALSAVEQRYHPRLGRTARFGVAEDVFLVNGRSFEEATISEVRRCLSARDIRLFIF